MKYFRLSAEYVLWELSYSNLNMYLATIPSYKEKKDEGMKEVESLNDLSHLLM